MRILILVLALMLAGCAQPTRSTGIINGRSGPILPEGIPQRVSVIVQGPPNLCSQAADTFAAELPALGFTLVERGLLTPVAGEINLSQGGAVSPETMIQRGKLIGAEGLFVGSVTAERSPAWTDTHLTIRLVETATGKTLWSVTAHDPRVMAFSMAPETSIIHTAKEAAKALRKDLKSAHAK